MHGHLLILFGVFVSLCLILVLAKKNEKESFGIVYYGKYSWNDNGFGLPMNQSNWSRGEFSSPFVYKNQGLYFPPAETLFNYDKY